MRYVAVMLMLGFGVAQAADISPFGIGGDSISARSWTTWAPIMAKAGCKWVRGFSAFNEIEPAEGTFNWASADATVGAAEQNGISDSGILLYGAPWIGGDLPVNNLKAWGDYVSACVTRYKGRIKYWEIWNETPNFIGKDTASDYARTVYTAYEAAKKADPTCQMGLSIQSVNVNWIVSVLDAGAKDHFDWISVHPYEVLGMVESDGIEAEFMSIVPTLRKMLADRDPARVKAPIWFTEIGYDAGKSEEAQASALVKAFAMSIAQGVEVVEWFEGKDGDSGPMGLLKADGTPRKSLTAYTTMTKYLGPTPKYLGWVLLNDRDYGFVFQGAAGMVMVTWARPGTTDKVEFGARVEIIDPSTGIFAQRSECDFTTLPVIVAGVPANLVKQAQANKSKPFPWDGDYTAAESVSVTMGDPNVEKGLHQIGASGAPVAQIDGQPCRDVSKGSGLSFTVDPNFLSYDMVPIQVTVVVRRKDAAVNAGFNLKYESTSGWHGIGPWNTIPADTQWHTLSWTIIDPRFVGMWGTNFGMDSDSQQYSGYYVRSVTVEKR